MTKTVNQLSLHQKIIEPTILVNQLEKIFETYSYLQSCVIVDADKPLSVISKKRLTATLSKPYVRELYAKKPVHLLHFVKTIDEQPLILEGTTPIAEAVSLALARDADRCYEPIVVNTKIGPQTLEVDLLLRAQSNILQESIDLKESLLTDVRNSAEELKRAIFDLEVAKERLEASEASLEQEVVKRTRQLEVVNADLVSQQAQIQSELQVARTLQQSILPSVFPDDTRFNGCAYMRAARMIGGDFFDVFKMDEHHLGVVVADVSGKGVPAAMFMVLVRTLLQEVARHSLRPGECLAQVNQQLLAKNPLSLFVTMLFGVLDARTGEFVFSNGGHSMPYLLRANGAIEAVATRGSPLVGLLDVAVYRDHKVYLSEQDQVLMITDGVTECFDSNEQVFGEERLLNFLTTKSKTPTKTIVDELIHRLDEFSDGTAPSDDVTVLGFQYQGLVGQSKTTSPEMPLAVEFSPNDSSPLKTLHTGIADPVDSLQS
jgi:serine phosphatase RsbU (regulator of sigma subunit)